MTTTPQMKNQTSQGVSYLVFAVLALMDHVMVLPKLCQGVLKRLLLVEFDPQHAVLKFPVVDDADIFDVDPVGC